MSIQVFAPASIGNFSVGYDLLGAAVTPVDGTLLGDLVTVSHSDGFELVTKGRFAKQLPSAPSDNIIYHCYQLFHHKLEAAVQNKQPLALTLEKNLPVGSGLGSSSSSIVATFVALNHWYKEPFSDRELLLMMGEMEAQISGSLHYDNIAPCFLGGLQLMSDDSSISNSLPWFEDWYIVIANPGTNILTKAARDALPEAIQLPKATSYAQNLANFIQSLYQRDKASALHHLKDVIAEPYRHVLLPNFKQVKQQLLQEGASAMGISGSGPTIFAICDDLAAANQAQQYLQKHYNENDRAFSHVCQLSLKGAQLINSHAESAPCLS